jgi:SAM-dependent methyltransferase
MHAHLTNIIAAESRRRPGDGPLRILDAGCGDGRFLGFAQQRLPVMTGRSIELHGFDVSDAAIQPPSFFVQTIDRLTRVDPSVDWSTRLHQITQADPWPFPESYFDVVVSNQVCEHVNNMESFLEQAASVTVQNGFSAHIFPLRRYTVEGHTGTPFGHRVLSHDVREIYFRHLARYGLARLGPLRKTPGETFEEFAVSRSDYISFETAYHTWPQLARAACMAGWRPTYRYTPNVYLLKIGSLAGLDIGTAYAKRRPLLDAASFWLLSLISSITLFLERQHTFDPDAYVRR